jgi:cation:H+ antiporter
MLIPLLLVVSGFALLTIGADILVRGAGRLALLFGISPLVVGLTVVAFGTSAPEAVVSLQSALIGKAGISVGNVVGSNIFNTFVVLGISALVTPLVVHSQVIRKEVPLLIMASLLIFFLSFDGLISRLDGMLLFSLIIGYTWWSIHVSRRETSEVSAAYNKHLKAHEETDFSATHPLPEPGPELPQVKRKGAKALFFNFFLVACGVVLLVVGSSLLVDGAVTIAGILGVSDLLIGLTIVSVGTSLPELATSLVAGIRGERDIAVGNAVGSSLFNILAVLGLAGLAAPTGVPVASSTIRVDLPVMIFSALACLPVFLTSHTISRAEGFFFLFYYTVYILYLVLDAVASPHLATLIDGVLYGLAPVTVVVAVYSMVKGVQQHKSGGYTLRK